MAVLTVYGREEDPVFQPASAGGDSFPNDGSVELLVMNNGVSSVVVQIPALRKCSHGFLDHKLVTAEAGELTSIGPLRPSRFNTTSGQASAVYSAHADLVVAARRLS